MKKHHKHILTMTGFLFIAIGTYNALMINSQTALNPSDVHSKRLDEHLGVIKAGRSLAVASNLEQVEPKLKPVQNKTANKTIQPEVSEETPRAAIEESLNLKLVEVINPKKWQNGLKAEQFHGNISANQGMIENLTAQLPDGQGIEISFSEMTGNTFEYDLNGQIFSALMYQVDQNTYMVTLTNGPLEGTRLRFSGEELSAEEDTKQRNEYLAENHQIQVGDFNNENQAVETINQDIATTEVAENVTFNFSQI